MTNDDLLAKLYDGLLTAEEKHELDVRVEHSPEFAAEVQEFLSIVHLLKKEKDEEEPNPVLLSNTRDKVLALIAAAGSVGAGGSLLQSPATGKIAGNMMQWIIGIIGVAGVSGIVIWNMLSHRQTDQTAREQVVVQAPSSQQHPMMDGMSGTTKPELSSPTPTHTVVPDGKSAKVPRVEGVPKKVVKTPEETGHNPSIQSNIPNPDHQQPIGAMATNPSGNDNGSDQNLDYLRKRLEQEKIKNNVSGQANALENIVKIEEKNSQWDEALKDAQQHLTLSKKLADDHGISRAYISIGRLQRKLREFDGSEQSLTKALDHSRNDEAVELRAIALGEIGLLYEAKGDFQLSIQKLNACVRLLEEHDSPNLGQWKAELQRVQLHH